MERMRGLGVGRGAEGGGVERDGEGGEERKGAQRLGSGAGGWMRVRIVDRMVWKDVLSRLLLRSWWE